MLLIENRQRKWDALSSSTTIHPTMTFVDNRLELGAGTILAQSHLGGLDLDAGEEDRVLALLSAAYQQAVDPRILRRLHLAGQEWHKGEDCLAYIHLSLCGLPRLVPLEEAAYRLFIADGLMAAGTKPCNIMRALDLDCSNIDGVEKVFNSAESRIPRGSEGGGQWTSTLGGDDIDASDLPDSRDIGDPDFPGQILPISSKIPQERPNSSFESPKYQPALIEAPDCEQMHRQCHGMC